MAYRVPFHNPSEQTDFQDINQPARKDSVRMANELRTEVEQVKERDDVKRALKQASPVEPKDQPKAETKDKLVLTTHVILLVLLWTLRSVLQFRLFGFPLRHPILIERIQNLILGVIGIVVILAVAKVGDVYLLSRIDSPVSRYNLRRVAKLMLGLLMFFMLV